MLNQDLIYLANIFEVFLEAHLKMVAFHFPKEAVSILGTGTPLDSSSATMSRALVHRKLNVVCIRAPGCGVGAVRERYSRRDENKS